MRRIYRSNDARGGAIIDTRRIHLTNFKSHQFNFLPPFAFVFLSRYRTVTFASSFAPLAIAAKESMRENENVSKNVVSPSKYDVEWSS